MRVRMIKYFIINQQKLNALLYSILCISLLLLAAACGEADHSSSGTGSISFSVEWQGAPTIKDASGSTVTRALDCNTSGVDTVEGKIYDENNTYLAGGGPWNCSAHAGTIENVPEGSNRKVVVLGKDSSGEIIYQGETTGIDVIAGQTTNAGEITVSSAIPANVTAVAGDGQITISWDSVSGATSYKIYWATWPGVSKTSYEGTTSPGTSANPNTSVFERVLSHNGHTYAVTIDSMTWKEADTLSNQHGGYIVTINDSEENTFLTDNYSSFLSESLWIGYSDKDNEGAWVWANGETSTYTNWASGEPDDAGGQDCGVILYYESGEWIDVPCFNTNRGIIEWEAATSYTHTGLPNGTTIYYVVTAVNDYGESGDSSEVNATPGTSQPPTEGLVAYYPFNGNANDESGNGNHGTVYGATLTTDRNGNANSAYSFDGVDDYVDCGNDASLSNSGNGFTDLTITFWFNTPITESTETVDYLLSKEAVGANAGDASFVFDHDTVRNSYIAFIDAHGTNKAGFPISDISVNTWHHISFVLNNSDGTIYLDGVAKETDAGYPSDIWGNSNPVVIASSAVGSGNFNGIIDNVRIYNRALSEAEIQALYNSN